jgi:hypothetical protein
VTPRGRGVQALVATGEDEKHLKAFHTYLYYVRSLAYLICRYHGDGDEVDLAALTRSIRSKPAFRRIVRRRRSPDLYEKQLKNAWFTEVALNIPALFNSPSEQVPYFNHWATVMAYYALHDAMRATIAVHDGRSTERMSHQSLLNQVGAYLANSRVFPIPWGVTCTGPEGVYEYLGKPDGAATECGSLIGRFREEQAWPSFCKALATTRRDEIADAVRRWKDTHHRKHIGHFERLRVGEAVKPTTFLNFLRRLRVRSNYVDSDAFAAALRRERDGAEFNRAIRNIVAGSMMMCETLIVAMAGESDIRRFAHWTTSRVEGAGMTLGRRMEFWSRQSGGPP